MRNELLLAAVLLTAPFAQAAENNACNNPTSDRQWRKMLDKHPADALVIKLAALRIGLCELIGQDRISVDQGTEIFEQERQKGIIERHNEELRQAPRVGT